MGRPFEEPLPNLSIARTYSAWYFVEIATLDLAPIGVGRIFDLTGSYSRTMLTLIAPVGFSFACLLLSAEISRRAGHAVGTYSVPSGN